MRICRIFGVVLVLVGTLTPTLRAQSSASPGHFDKVRALLTTYCQDCHQGKSAAGQLDLSKFTTLEEVLAAPDAWQKIFFRVRSGEMPPQGHPALSAADRGRFLAWIESALRARACPVGISPGLNPLRRLNRSEYSATIRDLLDIQIDAGHNLPLEGAGGEGFDNAAGTLTLSPLHTEKYLEAAQQALTYALKEPRSREVLLVAQPSRTTTAEQAARKVLEAFLLRAYRRPPTTHEVQHSLELFAHAQARGETFEDSVLLTLQGALISPQFLFLLEDPNPHPGPQPANDFEFASRLSYFLWGSMPDQTLLDLAARGQLHNRSTVRQQVVRLLRESAVDKRRDTQEIASARRVRDFSRRFVEQWLGTRELGRGIKPDPDLFPEFYDPELQSLIRDEPTLFLEQILIGNRSLLDLLDSDWLLLNDKLRAHYNIATPMANTWKAGEDHRGGLLGMAAVLSVTSYPNRTSPVRRGNWILDTLLGTPVPPPPENVPLLAGTHQGRQLTLRERLSQHRQNPACSSCHDRIDPLGFALSNYDALGRWRTIESGEPIDATGEFPDGTVVDGPEQLKEALLSRKDLFIRNLTRKMLGYALGRGLTFDDYCTVDNIVRQLEQDGYRSQTLIQGIVASVPFRFKPGTDPALAVAAR